MKVQLLLRDAWSSVCLADSARSFSFSGPVQRAEEPAGGEAGL